MRIRTLVALAALSLAAALQPVHVSAQAGNAALAERVEAAQAAAGVEHLSFFAATCAVPMEAIGRTMPEVDVPGAFPSTDPDRSWYTPPVQVFDDLFYLGQTAYSVWGLRTSEGVILVDAIFDYSVEAEAIEGLRSLGIDPDEIRYVIISHAHGDHSGGAGVLQAHGARVIMSEADWDLYERTSSDSIVATRDIVATDGMELELGGKTLRIYVTPGHTHGTVSTILPVTDGGESHVAAVWGGTLFNFRDSPEDPRDARLGMYAGSAARFRDIAREAGVDIILSNHPRYDVSTVKIPQLAERGADDPHPYVIGVDAVSRFLTVGEECARATRIAERAPTI